MAEKAQYLTKKVEEAQRHESSNNIGESIKIYEEVIKL